MANYCYSRSRIDRSAQREACRGDNLSGLSSVNRFSNIYRMRVA
jgi:hypothetical protein